jgi:hypothetical protein
MKYIDYVHHPYYEKVLDEILCGNVDAKLMERAEKKSKSLEEAEAIYVIMKLKKIDKH